MLVPLEIDDAVLLLVAASAAPHGDATLVVPARVLLEGAGQALLGL